MSWSDFNNVKLFIIVFLDNALVILICVQGIVNHLWTHIINWSLNDVNYNRLEFLCFVALVKLNLKSLGI